MAPNYALVMENLEKFMAGFSFIDFYHKSCFELLYQVMLGATFLWPFSDATHCHLELLKATKKTDVGNIAAYNATGKQVVRKKKVKYPVSPWDVSR